MTTTTSHAQHKSPAQQDELAGPHFSQAEQAAAARYSIKDWLEQDSTIKREDLCLYVTLKGLNPDTAYEGIEFTHAELGAALAEVADLRAKVQQDNNLSAENSAVVTSREGAMVGFICRRPTAAISERFMNSLLSDSAKDKTAAQRQIFNDCVLWPLPERRQQILGRYTMMVYGLGAQLYEIASGVKIDSEKKR